MESTQKQSTCFFVCGRERLNSGATGGGGGGENKADSGELSLYSPLKVVAFVAMMCGMLVLMYFFYNVLGECDEIPLMCIERSSIGLCCNDVLCSSFPASLHHYCYILPGVCLCTVQLP